MAMQPHSATKRVGVTGEYLFPRHASVAKIFILLSLASLRVSPVIARENLAPDQQEYTQGTSLVREGKVREALALFREALRTNPENPLLLNATGAALCLNGDTLEAVGYFLKALAIDPTFKPAKTSRLTISI